MRVNVARRRAAKAVRRKQVLAQRRKAVPVSLAEKVRCFAGRPLYRCLLHGDPNVGGIATVFLTREAETGQIAMAAFLVDTYALGIKDVVFRLMEPSDFDQFIAMACVAEPVIRVEPSHARKLVREARAYAASLGLRPPRNFAAVEQLFGDVRADDCTETFTFGHEGKPFYVVGPSETVSQIAKRLGTLVERLGPSGFDVMIPLDDSDELDVALAEIEPPEKGADAA
jgi:hypothetical protein